MYGNMGFGISDVLFERVNKPIIIDHRSTTSAKYSCVPNNSVGRIIAQGGIGSPKLIKAQGWIIAQGRSSPKLINARDQIIAQWGMAEEQYPNGAAVLHTKKVGFLGWKYQLLHLCQPYQESHSSMTSSLCHQPGGCVTSQDAGRLIKSIVVHKI